MVEAVHWNGSNHKEIIDFRASLNNITENSMDENNLAEEKFFEIMSDEGINIKFKKQLKSNDILKIIKDVIK